MEELRAIETELEMARGVREESGLGPVRATLKALTRREPALLALADSFRRSGDGPSLAAAERLLEAVVSELARLVDAAGALAERASFAATGGSGGGEASSSAAAAATAATQSVGSPRSSKHKKHHHHRHHHKHKDDEKTPPPEAAAAVAAVAAEKAAPPATPQLAQVERMSDETRQLMAGPPEIPPEEIELAGLIGAGAFGKVYRGRVRGKPVAVKVPNKQDLNDKQLAMFKHEVTIMKKIFHTNTVLFLGACMQPGKLMIVTELMQLDLEHLIHDPSRPRLSLTRKLRLAMDAALGMNWLHGICNIIHRDLKPANLLLDENMHVKVTDFGFSEVLKDGGRARDMRGPKGTALYMAPEVMRLEEFDQSSDVYGFGLILWELATEIEPFEEYSDLQPFIRAISQLHERPPLDDGPAATLPASLKSLIQRCWDKDPKARPNFSQITDDLEVCIVDAAMDEPATTPASLFWKAHFMKPLQEIVAWPDFEGVLARQLGVAPIQLEKLKNCLATAPPTAELRSARKVVPIERFVLFYRWFGNFFDPPNGSKVLREINQVLTAPWFHGDITQEEAQARLSQRADGTFLIRMSFKDPRHAPFTISKLKSSVPVHKRIARLSYDVDSQARFAVQAGDQEARPFPSLVALVETLRREGNLGIPCEKCVVQNPYSDYGGVH